MHNQAPLSPAPVPYEESGENQDAGSRDPWPADSNADRDDADRGDANRGDANRGDINWIINKVEQIHAVDRAVGRAVDRVAEGDSAQPRSTLAAIIRLQSAEIERQALENDRLAERLDSVHRLIDDERNQRRILDRQLREANLRNAPAPPVLDVEEIRRAAREGMSAEIKPVLMAILDLLETTLPRDAETAPSAAMAAQTPESAPESTPESTPVSTPAGLVAEVIEDFRRLPDILTRPIEELTNGAGSAEPAPDQVAAPATPFRLLESPVRQPRPPRHQAPGSAMPSAFAWTSLFS